jgi:hypothetical protein
MAGINLDIEIDKLRNQQELKKKENKAISIDEIQNRLKLLIDKSPLQQEEEIEKLVKETGKRKIIIQRELDILLENRKK